MPSPRRPSGLHFAGVLSPQDTNSFSSPSSATEGPFRPANGYQTDSAAPFSYSRTHLLSLWDERATAELPPDMAASLSALGGDPSATNYHVNPASLVISQESLGQPLGLKPLTADEEKWYSSHRASDNPDGINNGTPDRNTARRHLNGTGGPWPSTERGSAIGIGTGATPSGTSPATLPPGSRRTSTNALRSSGSALTGIQGGVLGSVAPPSVGRRGHRTGEGSEGARRSVTVA